MGRGVAQRQPLSKPLSAPRLVNAKTVVMATNVKAYVGLVREPNTLEELACAIIAGSRVTSVWPYGTEYFGYETRCYLVPSTSGKPVAKLLGMARYLVWGEDEELTIESRRLTKPLCSCKNERYPYGPGGSNILTYDRLLLSDVFEHIQRHSFSAEELANRLMRTNLDEREIA